MTRAGGSMPGYLSALLLLVAGCAPANREELVKEVLAVDPKFQTTLNQHRDLANKIETYKRELELKRSTVEQQVARLKKDLVDTTGAVKSRIEETKKRLAPEQAKLEQALALASDELRAKRAERASVGRSLSQRKKALNNTKVPWTDEERAHQQIQIDETIADAARIDQELATLREHVRLLKIKLLLLKL